MMTKPILKQSSVMTWHGQLTLDMRQLRNAIILYLRTEGFDVPENDTVQIHLDGAELAYSFEDLTIAWTKQEEIK